MGGLVLDPPLWPGCRIRSTASWSDRPGDATALELVDHAPGAQPDAAVHLQAVPRLERPDRALRVRVEDAGDRDGRVGAILVEPPLEELDLGRVGGDAAAPEDRVRGGAIVDAALQHAADEPGDRPVARLVLERHQAERAAPGRNADGAVCGHGLGDALRAAGRRGAGRARHGTTLTDRRAEPSERSTRRAARIWSTAKWQR
jgi:hypothetical protein